MDAYGHVNNAVYLTYLEECRDAWAQALLGSVGGSWNFVLAHIGIDYRRQLTQDDGEVVVRCRLSSIGRSSMRTREEILTADGVVAADAEAVVVPRDPDADRSRPLTDQERTLLEAELERDAGEDAASGSTRRPWTK